MNEEQLQWVQAAKAGNHDAFARLIRAYQDAVYRTAYAIVRDRADAEDVAQETFVRAYVSLRRLREERAFPKWIATIATRLALDAVRRKPSGLAALDEPLSSIPEPTPSAALSPDFRLDFSAALSQLSPEHRAVIALRELQGFDYQEMADILGVPIGTVRSRLHHARQQLRHLLYPYGERGEGR